MSKTSKPNLTYTEVRELLEFDGALLTPASVALVTTLSIPTLYRKVRSGEFPAQVKFGSRCTRWRSEDVRKWMSSTSPCFAKGAEE